MIHNDVSLTVPECLLSFTDAEETILKHSDSVSCTVKAEQESTL